MKYQFIKQLIFICILTSAVFYFTQDVEAYAPIIRGRVCEANTGPVETCKPLVGVYVKWTSRVARIEAASACFTNNPIDRYTRTDKDGYYIFPSWRSYTVSGPDFTSIADYNRYIDAGWKNCNSCKTSATRGTSCGCNPGLPKQQGSLDNLMEYQNTIDHDKDPNTPEVRMVGSYCGHQYNCHAGSKHEFTAVPNTDYKGTFTTTYGTGKIDDDGIEGDGITILNSTDYEVNITYTPSKITKVSSVSPAPKAAISTAKGVACVASGPCSLNDVKCSNSTESSEELKKVRMRIEGLASVLKEAPTSEKPAYLVQCNRKGQTYDCSSGNAAIDTALGLKNAGSVQVKGIYAEDGTTKLDSSKFTSKLAEAYEWETTVPTSGQSYYSFYLISDSEQIQQGGVGGQQQGTLSFAGCTEITDPKGLVFDSHTLEPLENVQVTLLKENQPGKFVSVANSEVPAGFQNPQTTAKDGKFSFNVPDGTYKLEPNLPGYTYPYDFTKLNKNAREFYENLYKGQPIIQKGKVIKTDIPLMPKDKNASEDYARSNMAQVISVVQSLDKQKQILSLNGTVSHPKAQLSIYSKRPTASGSFERGRLIKRAAADKEGKFSMKIELKSLRKGEVVGDIEVKKHPGFKFESTRIQTQNIFSDLEHIFSSFGQVQAYQTTSVYSLQPLLNYVEGYAKDEQGNILPNAKIKVIVPIMEQPIYQTQADANGYFKIGSEYLPNTPYTLVYQTAQKGEMLVGTNTFLVQNRNTDSVNYYAYIQSNGEYLASTVPAPIEDLSGQVAGVDTSRSAMRYMSFLLFILVIGMSSLLLMHVSKRTQNA